MSAKPSSRNPVGICTKKPIALRLMPKELAHAKQVASDQGLSDSALARKAFLKGLPLIEQQVEES